MAHRLRHHIGVPAVVNTAINRRELFGLSNHVPSVPTAAKVDKNAYQVNNIIPNSNDTVKKSNFFAVFCCFGIHVDQTLDFINGCAALTGEMRGDDISSVANLLFHLHRLLCFLIHVVTPCIFFEWSKIDKNRALMQARPLM